MRIVLECFEDGWRGALIDNTKKVIDTTVDVYPTVELLISRIDETKTWIDDCKSVPSRVDQSIFK